MVFEETTHLKCERELILDMVSFNKVRRNDKICLIYHICTFLTGTKDIIISEYVHFIYSVFTRIEI